MPSVQLMDSTKMSVLDEASARAPNGNEESADNEVAKENSSPAAVEQQQPSSNTTNSKESLSPIQQMCLIIEHKIRNLEKRKNKLDAYKLHEQEGKHLSNDQKMAILKYDECATSLELSRELCKQFTSIATVANREAKKQARKNAFLKIQQETAKIRECLVILDVVSRFTEDVVREDFLHGTNGACQLSEVDIDLLMMVYEQTKPKRPSKSSDKSFSCAFKNAAEILSGIVDGKSKTFGNSNYAHAKAILSSIENCSYFENHVLQEESVSRPGEEMGQHSENANDGGSEMNDAMIPPVEGVPASVVTPNIVDGQPLIFAEAPSANAVPTPSFPLQVNEMQTNVLSTPQTIIPTMQPQPTPTNAFVAAKDRIQSAVIVPAATINLPVISSVATALQLAAPTVAATTVQAVENAYFKQHYMQNQLRPLQEVLGDANFFFLQESEIDKPDITSVPSNYIPVDKPVTNLPLPAAGNEFQQFPIVPDSHLVMSLKPPIHGTPCSEMTQNVIMSNSTGVGSNAFNSHIGLVNEAQIMNIQPFQGPIVNQNTLNGMQLLQTEEQNVSTQHTVTMHMPTPPYAQTQHGLPDTNEIAASGKEPQRSHIHGFAPSNMIASSILPESRVQQLAKHPEIAHASVQTNKSIGEPATNDIPKGNHTLHNTCDSVTTPVSMVANVYPHVPTSNMYTDSTLDHGITIPRTVSSADLQQTLGGVSTDNVSQKLNAENKQDLNTNDGLFSLNCNGQANRKEACGSTETITEQKEWVKGSNKNDQWPSSATSVTQPQLKKDDLNRIRLSGNGQTTDAGLVSATTNSASDQNQSNGATSVKSFISSATVPNKPNNSHIQSSNNLHGVSSGYRNNRSLNPQYTQNGRFNAENGASSKNHPTFFKNNERFYQNNYGSQRGGTVYKGRSENVGGIPSSRINNSAYSANISTTVGNSTGNTSVGSSEYRNTQNVRSRNNARNNDSLGTRSHHRNNSTNMSFSNHSRKDSTARTQPGVNF